MGFVDGVNVGSVDGLNVGSVDGWDVGLVDGADVVGMDVIGENDGVILAPVGAFVG